MADSFFDKNKKKGLAALLLLLFGGAKRNALLVLIVGIAALLSVGIAGIVNRFSGAGAGSRVAGAGGKAALESTPFSEDEAEKIRQEAANRRQSSLGIPGKARTGRNEALNYVGRDGKLIGDAEAQAKLDKASAGMDYEGPTIGQGNRLAGAQGAGSLGMAVPGEGVGGGSGGPSFTIRDGDSRMLDGMKANMPAAPKLNMKPPKGGSLGGARGGKGEGGKLSGFKNTSASTRVIKGKKIATKAPSKKLGFAMRQLSRAASYTMASAMCKGCARESAAVYNRAYATGETMDGLGVISLPGDDPVSVSPEAMDNSLPGTDNLTNKVSGYSQECKDAIKKNGQRQTDLTRQMRAVRWEDGKLEKPPKKCCQVKDYNDKVDEYRRLCTEANDLTSATNKACGFGESAATTQCDMYDSMKMKKCGWFKCHALAIVLILVIIIIIVVAIVLTGGAAAAGAGAAAGSTGAAGGGAGAAAGGAAAASASASATAAAGAGATVTGVGTASTLVGTVATATAVGAAGAATATAVTIAGVTMALSTMMTMMAAIAGAALTVVINDFMGS